MREPWKIIFQNKKKLIQHPTVQGKTQTKQLNVRPRSMLGEKFQGQPFDVTSKSPNLKQDQELR